MKKLLLLTFALTFVSCAHSHNKSGECSKKSCPKVAKSCCAKKKQCSLKDKKAHAKSCKAHKKCDGKSCKTKS
ncbi:hypothetical protein A9Q84_18035 [Halobacteriovorax marinus]|uniref:Lipoprotein n=1 Tax=Halobacteriovorax marinus TaxID=97084 RepID=A0A1Y5F3X0_9BACT|nr:hypothetical protein A9Q84_18035 [Halobacteriovorax marinus]